MTLWNQSTKCLSLEMWLLLVCSVIWWLLSCVIRKTTSFSRREREGGPRTTRNERHGSNLSTGQQQKHTGQVRSYAPAVYLAGRCVGLL